MARAFKYEFRDFALKRARELALGYLFWVAFLLTLEPGNVMRALNAGGEVDVAREALRIHSGGCIGAIASLFLLSLTRDFPIKSWPSWRNLAIHAAWAVGLSGALIFIAREMVMALYGWRQAPLTNQLAANWTLLAAAMAFYIALAHLFLYGPLRPKGETTLGRFEVKDRGRTTYVDAHEVDWIEAQGNYLALHIGETTHLLRETVGALMKKLGSNFVRVHRGAIVNLNKVAGLSSLKGGDALVRLKSGQSVRMSRSYAGAVKRRLGTSE